MPIYNNPALGQAFENIAGMFAPPSGAEAAGWAAANAKNAERERLQWLFSNSDDPTASSRSALTGVQSYGNTPAGFAAADATDRYGYDTSAATSRANNAATVAGGIKQQQLSSLAGLFGPLAEGQVRPELPPEIAGMYGASGALPQAEGRAAPMTSDEVIAQAILGQGPGVAQQYAANKFAPSETQVKGRIVQGLPEADQRDLALGDIPIEQIIAEDGTTPVNVRRTDAVGQTPYFNKGAEAKPTNGLAVLPDGSRVPAIQGPDGRWADAQTGQPLPAGIQVFDMPKPTGTNEEIGLGKTSNNYVERALIDTSIARDTAVQLRDLIATSPASQGAVGWMRGTAQNVVQAGGEVGQYFGGRLAEVAKDIESGAADSGLAGAFDPSIPAIEMLSNLLAFQYAKTTTGERLSNEMLRSAKAALGLDSLTANQADATARLNRAIQQIDNQARILQGVRTNGVGGIGSEQDAPPATSAVTPGGAPVAGAVEDGYRFRGGDPADPANWEQVQ